MRQTPKSFRGARTTLEVLYHHAKFGGARISPAVGVAKNVEFFVCLSVCLSVTLLNVRVVHPISPRRHWSTETILMPLDRERVRHLGLQSVGGGFKSCSRQRCVTTLGKLFTPMCLCHQAV